MTRRLIGPALLGLGDRVVCDGVEKTIVGLSGPRVLLAGADGLVAEVLLAELLSGEGFARLDGPARPRLPAAGLDQLPLAVVDHVLWWERHVLEVLRGMPPDADVAAVPRPEYDPARTSLAARERAKAAELSAAGHQLSARTVKHYRQRYEAGGVLGLADGRASRRTTEFGRVDERVVAAMRIAVAETAEASSRTIEFTLWRTERILEAEHGPGVVKVPSRSTLYRLFAKVAVGTHASGSARTRRSLANRPKDPFAVVAASAPGELMQIDSTPLDVLVRMGDGVAGRVELTAMIDVATRTVTAAVLRPAAKSVDASVLLARTVTPEPMRPGWVEALRMSRSVLPHQRLLDLDDRLAHAAARPVIVPETIVCDHGRVFVSRNFQSSCRFLGINFQPAREGTPTDKPHIERMIMSVGTLFAQFVAGYVGSNVDRRGRAVDAGPLWSLPELQELLDEWIVSTWQNRPHDGLRDPDSPGRMFTPNEKYATLIEAAGYIAVALSPDDHVELLPAVWRAVNAYGVKIDHRIYNDELLDPLRHQPSGVAERKDLWEIHHDPYDISRVWLRDHRSGGWITLFWRHLRRDAVPFGELAWDHARAGLPGATEAEIAEAVQALLTKAVGGPATAEPSKRSRRDKRAAARTAATAPAQWPDPPQSAAAEAIDKEDADDARLAPVIPLGVFDAYQEANKRW